MSTQLTVKEFAKKNSVTPLAAQGLITYLSIKGFIKKVGTQKTATGKGRSSAVYEFPDEINMKF